MSIENTTYRLLVEKLGAANADTFVGNEGEAFYNPSVADLKLSDGSTPGGISFGNTAAGEMAAYKGFTAYVNRFWGNDPSINQIVIARTFSDGEGDFYDVKPFFFNRSTDTDADDFTVANLRQVTQFICFVNVYGAEQFVNSEIASPINTADLKKFAKKFIDTVLLNETGGFIEEPQDCKNLFYDNIDQLKATLPALYQNFEFDLADGDNFISDGGSDQYDMGNFINSYDIDGNENTNIPYGDGETEEVGFFGPLSSHITVYQDSIWAMIVRNPGVDSVWYGGYTGADTGGQKQCEILFGDAAQAKLCAKNDTNTSSYTLRLSDIGGFVYCTDATITMPYENDIPFPNGSEIKLVVQGDPITLNPSGSSIVFVVNGTSTTVGISIPANTVATLLKVDDDRWYVSYVPPVLP